MRHAFDKFLSDIFLPRQIGTKVLNANSRNKSRKSPKEKALLLQTNDKEQIQKKEQKRTI